MRVVVRCSGWIAKRNRLCNRVVALVDIARWEQDMASEAELCCESCGKRYTLAEYLGRLPT